MFRPLQKVAFFLVLFSPLPVFPVAASDHIAESISLEYLDKEAKLACDRVKDVPFPAEDRPSPAEIKSLKKCSSFDLFHGIDVTADPVKARKCAYVERIQGDQTVFGGSAMIMQIYATGKGVRPNFDLAMKMACKVSFSPNSLKYRVRDLTKLKKKGRKASKFHLCVHFTSGYMQGHCASRTAYFKSLKREKRFAALMAGWNKQDKTAFGKLRDAADKYFKTRVDNEVDLSGTGRAAFMIQEEQSLEKKFAASLHEFEKGKLPRYSERNFSAADAKLNVVYRKIQRNKKFSYGTVERRGIKLTQRTWIRYRDAWVKFAMKKYPAADAVSFKTWLTRERTKMLDDFLR